MKVELLAPAGDKQTAFVALQSGADAIYLGLTRFSARASAANFGFAELARVARYAHLLGAKVYVALNILVKDDETEEFFRSAREAWDAGADAILMQDLFLGRELKRRYPEMTLHLSTQAGCCNVYGARLAKKCGFSRVVLARETPLAEIALIAKEIETEVFVQGALCTAFSGQCYLSSFAGNNSGNRGRCKQPCRMRYSFDRAGYEEFAYALSTADLCTGERTRELVEAGVVSLKIEGRLRRPEYVAAAVSYYRAILEGEPADGAFARMARAYNRGDYTEGLAFGQKHFLSRNVQGHIGVRAGTVERVPGGYFCKSDYPAGRGDGFKILRNGREVCGASFISAVKGGFFLFAYPLLRTGDEVRVTTCAADEGNFPPPVRRRIEVRVRIVGGERPRATCGDLTVEGAKAAELARNAPLTAETVADCFTRTDLMPFAPAIEAETENAFLTKGQLNDFRRAFYAALAQKLAPAREPLPERGGELALETAESGQTAAISSGDVPADLLIYKPRDYAELTPPRAGSFLYLPPFLTTEETDGVLSRAEGFAGVYCDGYYALEAGKKYGLAVFAGTGFNLSNRFAVAGVKEAGADFFALSKEISLAEQRALAAEGAFALSVGDVKVMDLIYCPFERTCANCDRRERYTMTDGEGRAFPVRRYRVGGACRFEVYNCAPLAAFNGKTGALADCSAGDTRLAAFARSPEEAGVSGATKGHAYRSVL